MEYPPSAGGRNSIKLDLSTSLLENDMAPKHNTNQTNNSEIRTLISQNNQLNDHVYNLQDELCYQKLHQQKINYLIHLL